MKIRKPWKCVAVLGACALAGCGSSSSSSPTSSGSPSANTSTSGGSTSSLIQATKVYSAFTGGTPGKANPSLSPVVIGFINDQGGALNYPEGGIAAAAAVSFVNNNLGGVGGHPVVLKTCFVSTSEAQGTSCAQQFLSQGAKVIAENTAILGGQAFHQALAGKIPVVIGDPISPADATAANSYGVSPGLFGSESGFLSYATRYIHAKTATLLYPSDNQAGIQSAQSLKPALAKVGIALTETGYSSTSPDMLPAVVAGRSSSTDFTIALLPSPPLCIAGYKAFQQAHVTKPIVALSLCIAPGVKAALGDYPQWIYQDPSTNPAEPEDAFTKGYVQVMSAYAGANANFGGNAPYAFTPVLAAVRAMNRAGGANASLAAIAQQLKTFKGPTPLFPPQVNYGAIPSLPNVPSLESRLFKYDGNGTWTDLTGGQWVLPKQ
jgi:branched-chain amino acid transport system substrate-binding protein